MIEINNLTKFIVDKKFFSNVAKIVLSEENKEKQTISLAFVGEKDIKELNKKFRKNNKTTDVLSFDLKGGEYLGEVVICPDIVKENAEKNKVSVKNELLKVFIHGILHLCGYEHEKSEKQAKEMEQKEKLYLSKI